MCNDISSMLHINGDCLVLIFSVVLKFSWLNFNIKRIFHDTYFLIKQFLKHVINLLTSSLNELI